MRLVEKVTGAQARKGVVGTRTNLMDFVPSTQARRMGIVRPQDSLQLARDDPHLKCHPSSYIIEDVKDCRKNVDCRISYKNDESKIDGKEQIDC